MDDKKKARGLDKIPDNIIDNIIIDVRDSLSIISRNAVTNGRKSYLNDSLTLLTELENEDLKLLINLVFYQQSLSVDRACQKGIDHIRIANIGNLVKNEIREEIVNFIKESEDYTEEDIQDIIDKHIAKRELLKINRALNINYTFNGKKEESK